MHHAQKDRLANMSKLEHLLAEALDEKRTEPVNVRILQALATKRWGFSYPKTLEYLRALADLQSISLDEKAGTISKFIDYSKLAPVDEAMK